MDSSGIVNYKHWINSCVKLGINCWKLLAKCEDQVKLFSKQ